jgi:hypothetical protein
MLCLVRKPPRLSWLLYTSQKIYLEKQPYRIQSSKLLLNLLSPRSLGPDGQDCAYDTPPPPPRPCLPLGPRLAPTVRFLTFAIVLFSIFSVSSFARGIDAENPAPTARAPLHLYFLLFWCPDAAVDPPLTNGDEHRCGGGRLRP